MATVDSRPLSSVRLPVLPDINTKGIYEGKYTDRNPDVRAAGKHTATGDTANQCLKPPHDRPQSPEAVRRFRATLYQDAGKARVFYGKAYDPHLQWAKEMTHGLNTQPSAFAKELVNPSPKTRFRQGLLDKREALYFSHKKAPLGVSHDQRPGLPDTLNPVDFTFGIKTLKDGTAGELVSPDKTYLEVEAESEEGRDLYRKTHADFLVGEMCNRNYVASNYSKDNKFGIPTPHDNDGRHVRQTLKWLHDTQCEKAAPVVSKRVDDFRERTQPQLGKVHDPIKDTLHVAPDHTFGILLKPDEYGAGDLMHNRSPGTYLRGKDRQRGVLAAIRQHLKKSNYHNFEDLSSAFIHYDKNNSGKINIEDLREACIQFNLPVEPELLEQLMDYCDVDRDGQINYLEFSNFLNWKDKMPTGLEGSGTVDEKDVVPKSPSSRESTPRRLEKQIDRAIGDHRTSSGMINAVIGGHSTRGYRTYGVPTVRSDIPAPRIRRVDDTTNYGDESDAYGLVNPSLYSHHGVYEKDFLRPRSLEEIRHIFFNIGLRMTLDNVDEIYKLAADRHPKGDVSVESFRNILDECQAEMQ